MTLYFIKAGPPPIHLCPNNRLQESAHLTLLTWPGYNQTPQAFNLVNVTGYNLTSQGLNNVAAYPATTRHTPTTLRELRSASSNFYCFDELAATTYQPSATRLQPDITPYSRNEG